MATRFNTYGQTGSLATENTQRLIKDTLSAGIDVNVITLPGQASSTNITAVASEILPDSKLPVSIDRTTVDVPIINGAIPLTTSISGSVSTTVSNNVNTTVTNNVNTTVTNTVSTNSNLTQLNGNTTSTNIGNSDSGTQRVILASDQKTALWSVVPVKNVRTPALNTYHFGFGCQIVGLSSTFWRFITPTSRLWIDSSSAGFSYSSDFFLPSSNTNLYVVSTSASDNSGGTGAQIVTLDYVDSNGNFTTAGANMNGTTPVLISVGSDFYRVIRMVVSTAGTSECNEGTINLVNDNMSTKFYPGCIAPKKNVWESSLMHLPKNAGLSFQDGRFTGIAIVDYVNYLWSNAGGGNEIVGIWVKRNTETTWKQVIAQYNNSDMFYVAKTNNITFPIQNNSWDILFALLKTQPGNTNLTIGVGIKYE